MGEPSLEVTQAGLGQSQQENLTNVWRLCQCHRVLQQLGPAPGTANPSAAPAVGAATQHIHPRCPMHAFK